MRQKKTETIQRRNTSFVPSMAKTFTLGFGAKAAKLDLNDKND